MSIDHAAAGEPDVKAPSVFLVGVDYGGDPAERPMFARSRNVFDEDEVANFDVCGGVFRPFGELLQIDRFERFPKSIQQVLRTSKPVTKRVAGFRLRRKDMSGCRGKQVRI